MANLRDLIKQNGQGVYSPSNKPTAADIGALSAEGNAKTATWADTVDVNTSTATGYYGVTWHSGDTLFASGNQGFTVRPSDGHVKMKHAYFNDRLGVNTSGHVFPVSTSYRTAGVYGVYDSHKVGHIWSMGTAYKINEAGTNFGNLYGLAYKHTNNSTGGTMAGGHQMVWCTNGTPRAAMGESGIWTSGRVTASALSLLSEHVASSVNLNDTRFETTGFFNMYKGSGVTFTNAPSDFDYGTLEVIGRGRAGSSFCTQILTWRSNGKQMIRTRTDGSFGWSGWARIYSDSQKPSPADIGALAASAKAADSNLLDGLDSTAFARLGTTSPSWNYCYVRRNDSANAAMYVMQRNASGDIARFFVGTSDSATSGNGLVVRGDGVSKFISNGKFAAIGCRNSSWCHLETDASNGFYSYDHIEVPTLTARDRVTAVDLNATGAASAQGLCYNSKTVVGGSNDGWLRLNPHNQFSSGIYCASSLVRTDGQITVGSYSKSSDSIRLTRPTSTSWGADKNAAIDIGGAQTSGSTATYLIRYTDAANARLFAIDTLDQTGDTRLWIGKNNKYFYFDNAGGFTAQGNVTAYSDKRVKKDFEVIPNALDKVMSLEGLTYTRTDNMNDVREAGLIAQEVEKVLPEAVKTIETDEIKDFKTLDYGRMVPLLLEAIKELNAKVANLEELKNAA